MNSTTKQMKHYIMRTTLACLLLMLASRFAHPQASSTVTLHDKITYGMSLEDFKAIHPDFRVSENSPRVYVSPPVRYTDLEIPAFRAAILNSLNRVARAAVVISYADQPKAERERLLNQAFSDLSTRWTKMYGQPLATSSGAYRNICFSRPGGTLVVLSHGAGDRVMVTYADDTLWRAIGLCIQGDPNLEKATFEGLKKCIFLPLASGDKNTVDRMARAVTALDLDMGWNSAESLGAKGLATLILIERDQAFRTKLTSLCKELELIR